MPATAAQGPPALLGSGAGGTPPSRAKAAREGGSGAAARGDASQNADHVHFKSHRLPGQRVVEIDQQGLRTVGIAHLHHHPGVGAHAVGRSKFHHLAHVVLLVGVAHFVEQLAPHPLLHVGVALAKSLALGQLERGACALGQAHQALLHGGRELAVAQRERGRLVGEGVDDVAGGTRQTVMQGQERTRLNCCHECLDKLAAFYGCPHTDPSAMPLKDLPLDAQPREKLLARGPAALSDAELLALLLRTGIAGKGVLQMAQELLEPPGKNGASGGFGGIAGLLHTSLADLARIKGLGPAKRAELVAVLELARRALAQQLREREAFDSPDAVKHYLQLHLAHKGHEVFAVLFLDSQHRLLALEELFRGTLTQTSVYPREVVLRALHHQAAAVVLAHNHPSGSVQPSRADEALTQTLKSTLALVDVRVLDHVIVAPGQALSMAEKGLV